MEGNRQRGTDIGKRQRETVKGGEREKGGGEGGEEGRERERGDRVGETQRRDIG
jgi:hypothetical protein